jgi:hypothetical protein
MAFSPPLDKGNFNLWFLLVQVYVLVILEQECTKAHLETEKLKKMLFGFETVTVTTITSTVFRITVPCSFA